MNIQIRTTTLIYIQPEITIITMFIKTGQFTQYAVALSASLMSINSGMVMGWPSPTLPKLEEGDLDTQISKTQTSWIASAAAIGAMVGPIFNSFLCDYYGRKKTTLIWAVPQIISWIMISFDDTFWMLLFAMFIGGISLGATYGLGPMYLCEIASDSTRGIMGNFSNISLVIGSLLEYAIVPAVSIHRNAQIALIVPVLLLLTFVWCPETPYYLVMKEKDEEAKRVLQILRGTEDVDKELETLKKCLNEQENQKGNIMDLLRVRTNRKAFFIVSILIILQQLVGLGAVLSYTHTVFMDSGSNLGSSEIGVILGLTSLVTCLTSSFLIDTWGRKPLLIISSITSVVPLISLGTFYYLKSVDYPNLQKITLVPIIALFLFNITVYIGVASIPYLVMSEMFPTDVRAVALGIFSIWGAAGQFSVIKLYQVVGDSFGIQTIYFAFAGISCLFAIFVALFLPETKGRSIYEIQKILNDKVK